MASPARVYLRKVSSSKRQAVKIGERIAGGGAGDIHRLPNRSDEVIKLYKSDKDRDLYAPKLEAMLDRKPILARGKPDFCQLAWPTAIAESKNGAFLGFTMPEIDFDGSVSLERMLQKRMRQVSGLPEFYGYRLTAAYNLALCVSAIHKRGHHIIDLKPVNCRLHAEEMLVSILDCDGFSVDGGKAGNFPAYQFTPEYIAPEASGKAPDTLGEQQDLFALAVIIFRLLNNGIHPFQARLVSGTNGGTIQDMINANFYAYGVKTSRKSKPARQSVHAYFPDKFRNLFDQAFQSSYRPSAAIWRDTLKDYADPSTGKLLRCEKKPAEHGHFDKGCGWCALEEINQKPIQKRRTKRTAKTSPPNTKPPRTIRTTITSPQSLTPSISLAGLSILRRRRSLIFTIMAAIILIGLAASLTDEMPETQKPPQQVQRPLVPQQTERAKPQKQQPPAAKRFLAPLPQQSKQRNKLRPTAPKKSTQPQFTQINKHGFIVGRAALRTNPGWKSAVILQVPPGTQVKVRAKVRRQNWYLIDLIEKMGSNRKTVRGFIHGKLIAIFR